MPNSTSTFTKRTRFEILRRDGHTCRYCGIVWRTVREATEVAANGR